LETEKLLRVVRVVINSFALILLGMLAYAFWSSNPAYSLLLAVAAIDQFEDVYYYVYRKRLFPDWFKPFDMVFEGVLFAIGLGMLFFSISYYVYFETWFFKALLPLSILIMYSAIEDIIIWSTPAPQPTQTQRFEMVMHYVRPKKEAVREEEGFRFVRRKH